VKLSSKGRYAVRALFDIAFFNEGRPTQVKDIADRQGIPPRFLEQIFQDLKRAGIVGSKRGPQGGYVLARPAEQISVGEVVQVIEGPVSLGEGERQKGPRIRREDGREVDGNRATDAVFADLSARIASCLSEVSIADVCSKADELRVRRPGADGYVYFI
jgi:Rrf2 family protein